MADNYCDMCKGEGKFLDNQCMYCNGTGEWNQAAQGYVKNHTCHCNMFDRKHCPVCKKKCHHDSSQNSRQKTTSGSGTSPPDIEMPVM